MVAVVNDDHHSKPCTSASCCSPSRLWRTIHTLIGAGHKRDLVKLFQDEKRAPHVLRVILTARMANDASQYPASHKHRVVQFDPALRADAARKFGKSVSDLNAVQLAIFHGREDMAIRILEFVQVRAQPTELQLFLNHVWGSRNTTLHLACFLGMAKLARLLLDLGASPDTRNARRLLPAECTTHRACLALFREQIKSTSPTVAPAKSRAPRTSAPLTRREPKRSPPPLKRPAASPAPVTVATVTMRPSTAHSSPNPLRLPGDTYFCQPGPDKVTSRLPPPSMSRSSSLSSISSSEDDEDDDEASLSDRSWSPPVSPALSRGTSMDDLRLASEEPVVARRPRQVHFDPQTVLIDACVRGDLPDVVNAVNALADTRLKKPPDIAEVTEISVGAQDRSLLHLALMHGHPKIVQYLIDSLHMDINRADADGWTALHYAAALARWDCFALLASLKGVDVFAETDDGWTVLDCIETDQDRDFCRSLIDRAIGHV